jgi:hypothetical protein
MLDLWLNLHRRPTYTILLEDGTQRDTTDDRLGQLHGSGSQSTSNALFVSSASTSSEVPAGNELQDQNQARAHAGADDAANDEVSALSQLPSRLESSSVAEPGMLSP